MRNIVRKFVVLFFALSYALTGIGQDGKVEMADAMRDNGRIYVVVAVVLTILAGLIFYLVRIDRKVSRLEKNK